MRNSKHKKRVIITGCYGQDGSYLVEHLHSLDYEIYGVCREELSMRSASIKEELVSEGIRINESHVSLYDYSEISSLINDIKPDLLFHVAAVHFSSEHIVNESVLEEQSLFEKNVHATANLLSACLIFSPVTHIIVAGSCLMYDGTNTCEQDEHTPYKSCSLYGIGKITESELVDYYRGKGLFAATAILFNHESHRRGESFVTKKIAKAITDIKDGKSNALRIGNVNTMKDWGYAGDYMRGMHLMATAPTPRDYILATGELHTIRDYISECARTLRLEDWENYLISDSSIITRKIECQLKGNPRRAEKELGWKREYSFQDLVQEMVERSGKGGHG